MELDTANLLLTAVNGEIAEVRAALDAQRRRRVVVPLDAADLWAAGDLTARRSVPTALVDGVVVMPGKRGQFAPRRVRVVWRSQSR